MQDYSNADPSRDFDLIPKGTLAFGILTIRRDQSGNVETTSKAGDSRFLDCEITLCEGPYNKRKIWTRIGTAGSEGFTNMGRSSIRSILEVGRGAGANNAAAYRINDYSELNGLKIAIEVKIEQQQGYADKNEVQTFLTPNPESTTSKKFAKLLEMAQRGLRVAIASARQDRRQARHRGPLRSNRRPPSNQQRNSSRASLSRRGFSSDVPF
jgi:hypothetical protein